MKKILKTLLFASLAICMAACSKNESKNYSSNTSEKTDIEAQKEDSESNKQAKKQEKTIDEIEKYLLQKNVLSGERIEMDAKLIGGISGFKYKDSSGEIYEYDINSKEYKKLANGGKIPIQGMDGFDVEAISINGKFVLIGEDVPQKLIDAFNSFE